MNKKNVILSILLAGYLLGLFVFYLKAAFHIKGWATAYYIWDKAIGCGFFFWYFIYLSCEKPVKISIAPVVVFSLIRLLWEIPSAIYNISASNSLMVAFLFIALVITTGIMLFRKDSKLVTFLVKNIP